MRIPVSRHGQIVVLACGIGLVGVFLAAMPGKTFALTPKSPEVLAAIEKGIKFLESSSHGRAIRRSSPAGSLPAETTADTEPVHPKVIAAADKMQKGLGAHDVAKLDPGVGHLQYRIVDHLSRGTRQPPP